MGRPGAYVGESVPLFVPERLHGVNARGARGGNDATAQVIARMIAINRYIVASQGFASNNMSTMVGARSCGKGKVGAVS